MTAFAQLNWEEFFETLQSLREFDLAQSAGVLAFLRLYLQLLVAQPDLLRPLHHDIIGSDADGRTQGIPWHTVDMSVVEEVFEGGVFGPLLRRYIPSLIA